MRALCMFAAIALMGNAEAAPSRDVVEKLLAGVEARASADDVRRLGPGVDHVLVAIAIDDRVTRVRRQRAMAALAAVPSVEGRDLLRSIIKERSRATEGADVIDLSVCVRALGAFGEEFAGDVLPLLAHPTGDVRIAAAESLARMRARATSGAMRLRLTIEREEDVRRALERSLALLESK